MNASINQDIRNLFVRLFKSLVAEEFEVCVISAFAGQEVGIKKVEDGIWVVSFLDYDLGYFDEKNSRIEPVEDPFNKKVLPMSPE